MPFYSYDEHEFFASDGAPDEIVGARAARRSNGSRRASRAITRARSRSASELEHGLSDVAFTNAYRVPFQYRDHVAPSTCAIGAFVEESAACD